MGIYTNSVNGFVDESGQEIDIDIDALCEAFFYDDHYADSDAEKRELLESAEIALLEKKNITNKIHHQIANVMVKKAEEENFKIKNGIK